MHAFTFSWTNKLCSILYAWNLNKQTHKQKRRTTTITKATMTTRRTVKIDTNKSDLDKYGSIVYKKGRNDIWNVYNYCKRAFIFFLIKIAFSHSPLPFPKSSSARNQRSFQTTCDRCCRDLAKEPSSFESWCCRWFLLITAVRRSLLALLVISVIIIRASDKKSEHWVTRWRSPYSWSRLAHRAPSNSSALEMFDFLDRRVRFK